MHVLLKEKREQMKRIKVLKAYFIVWLFILYVVWVNSELLGIFFMATVIFSSAILGLLAVGSLYQIASGFGIMMLGGTFGALAYKKTGYEFYLKAIDSILPANIAHMLKVRKSQQKMLFTQEESRNIIEWLDEKFKKQKSYTNFFINTAMLIGLLGTFVGLVESIDHMGQIILGLNGDIDIKQIMQDFSGPLSGMAIGFGASLFGVVCAVILGINGYVLFRSQDTLISGIEDWLKDRIIDVVPETMGRALSEGATLPEQRKSFIDVFLEQMSQLTHEMSRLASSHDKFTVMNETLSSMKETLDAQQKSLLSVAVASESQVSQLLNLNQNSQRTQAMMQEHHTEGTTAINTLFGHQNSILKEQNEFLTAHNELAMRLLTLQESMKTQSKQHHDMSQSKLDEMQTVWLQETQQLATILQAHSLKWNELTQALHTLQDDLHTSHQDVLHHNTLLNNLLSIQNEGWAQTQHANELLQKQLKSLDGHMVNEIALMNSLYEHHQLQDQLSQQHYEYIRGILDAMQTTHITSKEALEALVHTQEALKNDTTQLSLKASKHWGDVEDLLGAQQKRLEALISAHEGFALRYSSTQSSVQTLLQNLDITMRQETEISSDLLDLSQQIHQTQQSHFNRSQELVEGLSTGLSKIEQTHLRSLDQQTHFESTYLENSEYKHTMMMKTLNDKLAHTQHKLESMDSSLKTIEERLYQMNQYNQMHHSSKTEEIKNFFSNFFTKKS